MLLIKHATLYTMENDEPPFQGDILLKEGKIAAIGARPLRGGGGGAGCLRSGGHPGPH